MKLTYDGSFVNEIPIPSGKFVITDAMFGKGLVYIAIEVNQGSGYVPVAIFFGFIVETATHTEIKRFNTGIVIEGGPGVTCRVRAKAEGSTPVDVNVTLRAYTVE